MASRNRRLPLLAVLILVVAACGPAAAPTVAPQPTATATRTAAPSPTPVAQGTPSLLASPTPAPTTPPTVAAEVKPKYGGSLIIPEREYPKSWDLAIDTTTRLTRPFSLIGSRILRYNGSPPECVPLPLEEELVERWKWLDDITLELNVRPGIFFHNLPPVNGRELTSQDILYNVEKQWPRNPWFEAPSTLIKRVEVPDKYTVRIYLKETWVYFMEVLADKLAYIVPREVYGPDGVMKAAQEVVGPGPFQLRQRLPGVKVAMERNPNYWRSGVPYLDQIEMIMMPDLGTQSAAFRSGRANLVMFEDIPPILDLERTYPTMLRAVCGNPIVPTIWLRTDRSPWNDVRVRRAVAMSIDRAALAKAVYFDKGTQAFTLVPALYPQYFLPLEEYPPEVRQYLEYHPDRAKQLLAEAGYPQGFTTEIAATPLRRTEAAIAEAVVGFLESVGIKAKLKVMDYTAWTGYVLAARYEGLGVGPTGVYTLDRLWEAVHSQSGVRNRSFINDPRIDRLVDESRWERDEARRKQIFKDFQIRMAEQAYMLNFPLAPFGAFAQPQVKDLWFKPYSSYPGDYLYKVWLDR